MAYFSNGKIPICGGEAAYSPNCGVYIEVHRAGHHVVVSDTQIKKEYADGYQTDFVPTHKVCAGDYELWWVVRSPAGPVVMHVKPFNVYGPSCPPPDGVEWKTDTNKQPVMIR